MPRIRHLAAAATLLLLLGTAAQAGNVLNCEAPTRAAVIACCKKVSAGRLPIWMQSSQTTCERQAFCAPRKGKTVCRIAPAPDVIEPEFWDISRPHGSQS